VFKRRFPPISYHTDDGAEPKDETRLFALEAVDRTAQAAEEPFHPWLFSPQI
jgi:hypothetical protein